MALPSYRNAVWILDRLSVRWARKQINSEDHVRQEWYVTLHKECDPFDVVLTSSIFLSAVTGVTLDDVYYTVAQSGPGDTTRGAKLVGTWNAEDIDCRFDKKSCIVTTTLYQVAPQWTPILPKA